MEIDSMTTPEVEALLCQTPVEDLSDAEVLDIYAALYGRDADTVSKARSSLHAVKRVLREE